MEQTHEKDLRLQKTDRLNNDLDMKIVRTAREVLGETVGLMVDVNAGWTKTEAVQRARRLEDYQLDWIEEPIDPLDLSGIATCGRRWYSYCDGLNHYAKEQFRDLVLNECADIYQPDPTGGRHQ